MAETCENMADDPVEEYLGNELCDDCEHWEQCNMARDDICLRQQEALTHYRKQKEELTQVKVERDHYREALEKKNDN